MDEQKTAQSQIGDIGESIAQQVLGGSLSEDPYDMDRDIILEDGTNVEVKTQVRWRNKDVFTVNDTVTGHNIEKCLNVDRLIFVEPTSNGTFRILECTERKYGVSHPRGRKTYTFPAGDMKLLDEVCRPDLWSDFMKLTRTSPEFLT